jgi:hypothetical protein
MAESMHELYPTSVIDRTNPSRIRTRPARVIGIENIRVCWFDESHKDESQHHAKSIFHLQQIVSSVQTFNDPDELVDFATEIKDQKLFAIIPVAFAEHIVPLFHNLPQIDSIYILCHGIIEHDKWTLQYRKVKGVYTNIEDICKHLKSHTSQTEHSLASISIFSSDTLKANDKIDLNNIDSSFMYSQLIKDMILETTYEQAETVPIGDFIEFCRKRYADNSVTLQVIEEFYREYYLRTPVWWYTR